MGRRFALRGMGAFRILPSRYGEGRFGRWLSADWSAVPSPVPYANLTNPQSLNLYAMVADDPESFADLDGHTSADHNDPCSNNPTICPNNGKTGPSPDTTVAQGQAQADEQNAAGNQHQKKKKPDTPPPTPLRVVSAGKPRVYSKPVRVSGSVCSSCYFEGTVYYYKVVDANGKTVKGDIAVDEHFTPVAPTTSTPPALEAKTSNGRFPDLVGALSSTGRFGAVTSSVVNQTFTVRVGGQELGVSTRIQQTVTSDARGNVAGVARTLDP
jgi:hypothetical protein